MQIIKPIQTSEDRKQAFEYLIKNNIGDMTQNIATIDMHLSKGKLTQAQVDELYALLPVVEDAEIVEEPVEETTV